MEDVVYVTSQIVTPATAYAYYARSLNPSRAGNL